MKISVDYSEVYQASVYVKNKADSYNDLIQNLYKKVEQMQSIWHHIYLYDRTNFKKFQF